MTAGLILAGGLARRMGGGDKPLQALGGQTVLDHVLARLRPQAAPLAISANGDPARFAAFGLPVLPDSVPGHPGPLAGVLAGLDWAAGLSGEAFLLTVPGDTPFLPDDLAVRLRAVRRGGAVVCCAASGGRLHPVVALWPVALRDALRAALAEGRRKVGAFAAQHGLVQAEWEVQDGDPFFNVNTPEELAVGESRVCRLQLRT